EPIAAQNIHPNYYAMGLQSETGGDVEEAIANFEIAAEDGSKDAMYSLGRLARDVQNDTSKAASWFHAAAERGDVFAQIELAVLYLRGVSTVSSDPDRDNARYWLEAAVQRDTEGRAAFLLFQLESAPKLAIEWLQKSADLGYPEAMGQLSNLYRRGAGGLPRNLALSQAWARKKTSAMSD
ncbi:tetratricopeptide repeat protein, partial [Propionivibrio sp.]|uniref:tetratricopeptide repeat protein n=1 Tax=Propionivibrio sp. TaxID=2212460 RepID=UPI003BF32BFF